MQPLRLRPPIQDERQTEVLERWGVRRCHLIDRAAFDAGLTRLIDPEDAVPAGPLEMVAHLRQDDGVTLQGLLEDAVQLARTGEDAHAADDAWPHGVCDDLDDLLQDLEVHDAHEDMAYRAAFDATDGRRRILQHMLDEHGAMRQRLARLRGRMRHYRLPEGACATWRLLYVLCQKVENVLVRRMRLEEEQLFGPALRNCPED
jgi:regulator of cell morphogenesis and NO signaling